MILYLSINKNFQRVLKMLSMRQLNMNWKAMLPISMNRQILKMILKIYKFWQLSVFFSPQNILRCIEFIQLRLFIKSNLGEGRNLKFLGEALLRNLFLLYYTQVLIPISCICEANRFPSILLWVSFTKPCPIW